MWFASVIIVFTSVIYDSVAVEPTIPVNPHAVDSVIKLHFPLKASKESIELLIHDLLILLRDNGFPFARIRPMGFDYINRKWVLRLGLDTGPPAVIAGVLADGKWRLYSDRIAQVVRMKGKLFNIAVFRRYELFLDENYSVKVDSFWFEPSDSGVLLHLLLDREAEEFVSGTAGFERKTGVVGSIRAKLNETLGGVQDIGFSWFRRSAESQSMTARYRNPWLIGAGTGVQAGVDYIAQPDFVMSKAELIVTQRFGNVEMGLGGGVQGGTIKRRFAVVTLTCCGGTARTEFSEAVFRLNARLECKFAVKRLAELSIMGGVFASGVRAGEQVERFRFGGAPDFIGVMPHGLIFSEGAWLSVVARREWFFTFLSAGRFDKNNLLRVGAGIAASGFSVSLALPAYLLTVDFRAGL